MSAHSYPTKDPQCSTHIHSSINAITIHPKQPEESQVNEPDVGQEEKGNLGNTNSNPHPQPDLLASIATKQVQKLNSMLESLGLVPRSSNAKFVCSKGDDGEVMFIEIEIMMNLERMVPMKAKGQRRKNRRKLDPRENANGGISNFTGRIKGMHVFVGNFTYVVDFMIVEDISSIIDPRLSQVVLGRPFIEISNMTHDLPEGVVRFTNENDEVAYKMPHKIEQYNSLSNLEKEHTKSVYLRNEEDKRRGVDYVMSKILGFYKECLELGPEYVTGLDDEGEVTNVIILAPSSERFDPLPMHIGNLYADDRKISKIVKAVERNVLLLKAKKESSDKECSTSGSEDEEYAMAVRHIKKFVKRRENALDVATHSILWECPKPLKIRTKRAFVGGSWSDSGEEDDEKVKDEMCLVAHASSEVCSESSYFSDENSSIDDIALDNEYDKYVLESTWSPTNRYSGCSKHMMGNRKLFSTYKAYNRGNVIFGSNLRGQICDNKHRVTFSERDSEITKNGKVIGSGIRKKGLYVIKLGNKPKDQICLTTINENSTLWHMRLGHANMRLIQSLASKELVRNLPKLKFDQKFYDACKIRKQAHASHKAKNVVSMTRCLDLLHIDLFCPSAVWSYRGKPLHPSPSVVTLEPKNVNEALGDESWIVTMQEELNQFVANYDLDVSSQPRI
ncbi:retrovirus-related pol polyprotein from transposon TNT 1-94 [Tanacetum coccineum]